MKNEPILRFGVDDSLRQFLEQRQGTWTNDMAAMFKEKCVPGTSHCVLKVSFELKGGSPDPNQAKVSFIESGEKQIKEEDLGAYVDKIFKRENCARAHELIVFYGRVNDTRTFIKNVEFQSMLGREKMVVDRLREKLGT